MKILWLVMMTAGPALVAAGCSSENIYWYQEQNCGKKDSPSDCKSCCKYYCRRYNDEDNCEDEFDSCVDDVSIQGVYKRSLALVCLCIFTYPTRVQVKYTLYFVRIRVTTHSHRLSRFSPDA